MVVLFSRERERRPRMEEVDNISSSKAFPSPLSPFTVIVVLFSVGDGKEVESRIRLRSVRWWWKISSCPAKSWSRFKKGLVRVSKSCCDCFRTTYRTIRNHIPRWNVPVTSSRLYSKRACVPTPLERIGNLKSRSCWRTSLVGLAILNGRPSIWKISFHTVASIFAASNFSFLFIKSRWSWLGAWDVVFWAKFSSNG